MRKHTHIDIDWQQALKWKASGKNCYKTVSSTGKKEVNSKERQGKKYLI